MYRLTGIAIALVSVTIGAQALVAQPGTPKAPPDKAVLVVRVQPDAVVTVDGNATTQKGRERIFITPQLESGVTYSQEIVASWKEGDQPKTAKRSVEFKAGQSKIIDLTKADADKVDVKKPEPEKKKPEPEKKKPEPETKKPEPETKKPEPEKKKPEPETKKPEPETKKPETKKPEPETKKPEPETKKPEPETKKPAVAARTRTFLFTYKALIKELPPGVMARVWLPIATSNDQQAVEIVEQFLGDAQMSKEKEYGNTMAFFEAAPNADGQIPFELTYKVTRKEVRAGTADGSYPSLASNEKVLRYLQPDSRVPIAGKPLEILQRNLGASGLPPAPLAAARVIYDIVRKHMTFKAGGAGVGQGDALWAADSRQGNSIDMHSLFAAMARGSQIPAKLELGFALPPKVGAVTSSHCWAWFLPDGKRWVPVDIAEASLHPERADVCFGNLNSSRIAFTVGRDITLEPRQKGAALNYFIDPYVEVDGKTYPADKVQHEYSYRDVP
jgi:uncharacterized protein (TIGR03000 family)